MHRTSYTVILLVLAFLGLADSWYLGISEYTNSPLTCSIDMLNGCNTVAQSPYSHLFGIPLGLYGVAFYAILFIVGASLFWVRTRLSYTMLHALGWIGLLSSLCFMLIQFFVIKALCIYCLGSALAAFLACLVTIELWKRYGKLIPKTVST